ncbi:energy transducer TonB [Flavobacterium sp. RHBU_24]|uniref:energy transducer TonB n=1 Tax=Flavobacterium sp. RHBU_24 TaxID=3391185 RepID=UPI003985017A
MAQLTKEEKESGIITVCIFAIVMLLLFVLKFDVDKQDEEKKEIVVMLEEGGGGGGGTTIDFGDSEVGAGIRDQSEAKSAAASAPSASAPAEEVVGSDDDKAEAVANTKPVENRSTRVETPKPETPKKPVVPAKPRNEALDNLLNGSNGGDGNTGQSGNQGRNNGISNGGYDGDGGTGGGRGGGTGSGNGTGTGPGSGSGSGGGSGAGNGTGVGNYKLAGRKVLTKPAPRYTCNEQGVVVVAIAVDQSGKVISANAGARGTTNSARCLADQAEAAALNTKFDSNPNAAEKQTGTIVYNFKLTE